MLSPVGHDDTAADLPVTFARLDGLDLRRAADGWHGVWQAGDIAHQFWLPEAMPDAAAFYAVTFSPFPADDHPSRGAASA